MGLARLSELEPAVPVQRYEHERPGELIHIDTKKLGRIEKTGHRDTGDRRVRSRGAGGEVLLSLSTIMPGSLIQSCIRMNHRKVLVASWPMPMRITAPWAPSPRHC